MKTLIFSKWRPFLLWSSVILLLSRTNFYLLFKEINCERNENELDVRDPLNAKSKLKGSELSDGHGTRKLAFRFEQELKSFTLREGRKFRAQESSAKFSEGRRGGGGTPFLQWEFSSAESQRRPHTISFLCATFLSPHANRELTTTFAQKNLISPQPPALWCRRTALPWRRPPPATGTHPSTGNVQSGGRTGQRTA